MRAQVVPFGKHCRSSPLVFSFVPRCHGLCGSQKQTATLVSIHSRACWAISVPWSQVSDRRSCSGKLVILARNRVAHRPGVVPGQRRPVLRTRFATVAVHAGQVQQRRRVAGAL